MSMKNAKKPNIAKQNPTNFFSNGQSAIPPAFTVGSGFAPDAVEFTITEVALWLLFAISKVALSATSLSLVDKIRIGAESQFFFAITFNREDLPAAAEATRDRAIADEEDVKANMFFFLGFVSIPRACVFVTSRAKYDVGRRIGSE